MQAFVSYIKELLLNWNAQTIQCTLLSAIITAAVFALLWWLLLAIYYHSKVSGIRRRSQKALTAAEQGRHHLSETLEAVTQQLQYAEQELGSKTQQLASAQQAVQTQVSQNQAFHDQIAQASGSLQAKLFSTQPLLELSNTDTSSPWQRYDYLVNQLTQRLQVLTQDQQSSQQEITRLNATLADQALTIQSVQQKNTAQATQLVQLEQDYEAQLSRLLEERAQLLQQKAEVVIKQPDVQFDTVVTSDAAINEVSLKAEENVKRIFPSFESIPQEPTLVEQADHLEQSAQVMAEKNGVSASPSKLKSLLGFGKASKPLKDLESLPLQEQDDQPIIENVVPVSDDVEASGPTSKLKGLFGLGKASKPKVTESVLSVETNDQPALEVVVGRTTPVPEDAEALVPTSKLKGVFGFGKSPKPVQEPTVANQTSILEAEQSTAPTSKLKGLLGIGKKSNAAQALTTADDIDQERERERGLEVERQREQARLRERETARNLVNKAPDENPEKLTLSTALKKALAIGDPNADEGTHSEAERERRERERELERQQNAASDLDDPIAELTSAILKFKNLFSRSK